MKYNWSAEEIYYKIFHKIIKKYKHNIEIPSFQKLYEIQIKIDDCIIATNLYCKFCKNDFILDLYTFNDKNYTKLIKYKDKYYHFMNNNEEYYQNNKEITCKEYIIKNIIE